MENMLLGTLWSADSQLLKWSRYDQENDLTLFGARYLLFSIFVFCFTGPASNAPKQESGTGEAPPAGEDEEKKKQKRGMVSDKDILSSVIVSRFCLKSFWFKSL